MVKRIGLMFIVAATLCGAAFTLGSSSSTSSLSSGSSSSGSSSIDSSSGGRQDASGIPPEHPLMLALHSPRELALTDRQIQMLDTMRDEMAKEFAPLRTQADALQHRLEAQQQSGNPDAATVAELRREGEALGAKLQPLFERYAQEVGKLLTDEQRQKLMQLLKLKNPSKAGDPPRDGPEFVLDTIMKSRDQLGVTPQQFTKLQYLLADFIRGFAPVREKMELLQLELLEKFGKAGTEPTTEYRQRAANLQNQVAALQAQYSAQAVKDVLDSNQRTKLEELLHGDHRITPNDR